MDRRIAELRFHFAEDIVKADYNGMKLRIRHSHFYERHILYNENLITTELLGGFATSVIVSFDCMIRKWPHPDDWPDIFLSDECHFVYGPSNEA